jgi:hypothetical protein
MARPTDERSPDVRPAFPSPHTGAPSGFPSNSSLSSPPTSTHPCFPQLEPTTRQPRCYAVPTMAPFSSRNRRSCLSHCKPESQRRRLGRNHAVSLIGHRTMCHNHQESRHHDDHGRLLEMSPLSNALKNLPTSSVS